MGKGRSNEVVPLTIGRQPVCNERQRAKYAVVSGRNLGLPEAREKRLTKAPMRRMTGVSDL